MSETVIEIVIRCPNSLTAEGVLAEIRHLLEADPLVHLDAAAMFAAEVYDAPEDLVEVMAVPA